MLYICIMLKSSWKHCSSFLAAIEREGIKVTGYKLFRNLSKTRAESNLSPLQPGSTSQAPSSPSSRRELEPRILGNPNANVLTGRERVGSVSGGQLLCNDMQLQSPNTGLNRITHNVTARKEFSFKLRKQIGLCASGRTDAHMWMW